MVPYEAVNSCSHFWNSSWASPPFKGLAAPSVFQLSPWNHSWWGRSALYKIETICLPMQIQRFNSTIWSAGSGAEYDFQPRDWYILSRAQSQNDSVEQYTAEPSTSWKLCPCDKFKGSALLNCFGFIDGAIKPICRPDENQGVVYNRHNECIVSSATLLSYLMVW